MGQYQQWRHYLEIDQQLRAQLETLKSELVLLQEDVQLLGEPDLPVDNQLLYALISHVSHTSPPTLPASFQTSSEHSSDGTSQSASAQPSEKKTPPFISSALFRSSRLPNLEAQASSVQEQQPAVSSNNTNNMSSPLPSIPHSDADLLPADMAAFFDAHAQTEPQIELPWWLRNITRTTRQPQTNGSHAPVDKESLRTNRLVQRWFERWGHQIPLKTQLSHPSQSSQPQPDQQKSLSEQE